MNGNSKTIERIAEAARMLRHSAPGNAGERQAARQMVNRSLVALDYASHLLAQESQERADHQAVAEQRRENAKHVGDWADEHWRDLALITRGPEQCATREETATGESERWCGRDQEERPTPCLSCPEIIDKFGPHQWRPMTAGRGSNGHPTPEASVERALQEIELATQAANGNDARATIALQEAASAGRRAMQYQRAHEGRRPGPQAK